MAMQLLRDLVLVKADPKDTQTKSGLFIASEWDKLPHTAVVIDVGPEVTEVTKDDHVHFNRYAFTPVGEDRFVGSIKNINFKFNANDETNG